MDEKDRAELRKEAAKQLIILVAAAATVALYAVGQRAMSDPDYLARLKMRLASAARRRVSGAARRFGRRGMTAELAGDQRAAEAWYGRAYQVMTGCHDRLSAWYEDQRA